jgi:FkbM family methyltransferase
MDVSVGELRLRCHFRDNHSERRFVFMPSRFDEAERRLLTESLPADGVFVDIGANVGIYALTAATRLGPEGRVIALEPNPPVFARLVFNLGATRAGRAAWPQVTPLALGINDAGGEVELHLDPRNLGGSSIVKRTAAADATRIPCRPLLPLLLELGVPRVDALKIDIEGAEDLALMPFLRAAPDALLPRLLFIENSEAVWRQDLPGALRARGYAPCLRTAMNTVLRRAA